MAQPPAIPVAPGVTIEGTDTVWNGRFPLQVVRFRHTRFDGHESGVRTWELWRRGRAAAVLPYDPAADAVVLIEQFRLPALAAGVDPMMVEVPAGLCDPGEDPAETGRRESGEELGMAISVLEPMGHFLLSPGGCDEHVYLFAGRVVAPPAGPDGLVNSGGGGLAAEQEDIRARVWPADDAIAAALGGLFPNVITSLALLWLAARRDHLRAAWRDTPP
jgi:ADP-ribose pyrophosphatase